MRLEENHQIALFRWAALSQSKYPELKLLYAVPNGGKRGGRMVYSARHKRMVPYEAVRLKRAGVKAGIPDIVLPVSRNGYHSLYIELKAGKGKPTEAQREWQALLNEHGNLAVVAYGWEEAREIVERYLGLNS